MKIPNDCYIVTVDFALADVYGIVDHRESIVGLIAPSSWTLKRIPRAFAAVLVLMAYLVSGLVHSMCDVGGFTPTSVVFEQSNDQTDGSSKAPAADHHCHGCFAAAEPSSPVIVSAIVTPSAAINMLRDIERHGLSPGLDPPPPRHLT